MRRLATALLLLAGTCWIGTAFASAQTTPTATLASEQQMKLFYQQGIARVKGGWVLSGTNAIARVDDKFRAKVTVNPAIPTEWRVKGYNHVGDIDVVGDFVYAPWEQSDYTRGEQVTARYRAKTLKFVDATVVAQHENSFVTVDPKTKILYSFDNFGGDAFFRYDLRKGFAPLPPLAMSAFVDKVQGADVRGGAIWLSTTDPNNGLYRVDLKTGVVDALGSAGHPGGEGEGIDATPLRSGQLHTLTVDAAGAPIWLGHFRVTG